jgi:PAS domain S-box-containing protein
MTKSNKGLRILIVEDNPADQNLLTDLLNASVIKIQLLTVAETLGKATALLQKEVFDIILLDLGLPDSAGIGTFTAIKQYAGKMPVIILSGLTDMNIAVEAISHGAQDYHIKGELDEKTLTKTILYSIERKRRSESPGDDDERYVMISKAELDLMKSEDITRRIISAALDAIVCIDIYGKITVWNPQSEKIFGWQQHEILGKTLTETIIPVEYRDLHEKGMKNYLATGEGKILNKLIEITAVNRAGKHFPVELSIVR